MTPLLQPRTSGRRTSPPKVMACNGPGPIVEITFRYQPAKSRHKLDELWTDTFPWQLGESDRRRVSRPGAAARLVPASTPGRDTRLRSDSPSCQGNVSVHNSSNLCLLFAG